jgi:hypothetical protein
VRLADYGHLVVVGKLAMLTENVCDMRKQNEAIEN